MKKLMTYLLFVLIALGCQKEEIPEEVEEKGLGCDVAIVDVITLDGPMVEIEYKSKILSVQEGEDFYVFEGDILIPKDIVRDKGANKSVATLDRHWVNNVVPYSIDPFMGNKQRVYDAIAHWESKTHVKFVERSSETDYVYFESNTSGCASHIGRNGGRQLIWLADACSTGNTIHEIGHALGLFHEQSRIDRDEYVTILWENISAGKEYNFDRADAMWHSVGDLTPNLDFGSVMMYHPYSFSKNGLPTIVKKDGSIFSVQRNGLSVGDIYGINQIYPDSSNPTEPDSDGDGTVDKDDRCPNQAGPSANGGCPWPDTDGDGVLDKDDRCPTQAGPSANGGCPWPDTDGDGILDKDDKCPNEAGPSANGGCPWNDSDGDGVLDKDDKCPNVVGPVENQGCPWPDTDGDGVLDKDDKCPNEAGPSANGGCPMAPPPTVIDTDKDGTPDSEDKCPNQVGPIENQGCPWPDTDKDGILDKDDKCPNEAGPSANGGCPWPDTDKDGIVDKNDRCPNQAGPIANGGCPWPDTDGDGVLDKDDNCPNEVGPSANGGCPWPDSDGDGILDKDDKCPYESGPTSNGGCPDTDGDGVLDKDDKCPNEVGPASNGGCPEPDSDGDGVADKDDECPYTAGLPQYKGCPEPDTDGDGIPDGIDLCPYQTGVITNDGCPEPEPTEYINGNYYVIAGERVLRNNDKWYLKRGKNWKEVELINNKWKVVTVKGNSKKK